VVLTCWTKSRGESRVRTPEFRIRIVQPGLAKSKAEREHREHLELLGATELYLKETYEIELGAITSA
jgi:hypothetical protein